jgi:hypothetical protein
MYLLDLFFEQARRNHCDRFVFSVNRGRIDKWIKLSPGPPGLELLRLMALACAGASFLKEIPFDFCELIIPGVNALKLEFIQAPHPGRESRKPLPARLGSGIEIDVRNNRIRALKRKECSRLPSCLTIRKPAFQTAGQKSSPGPGRHPG